MSQQAQKAPYRSLLKRQEIVFTSNSSSLAAQHHIENFSFCANNQSVLAIFSSCPHLLQLSQFYASEYLHHILNGNWASCLNLIKETFDANMSCLKAEDDVLKALRHFKHQSYYVIAMGELLGSISIDESCTLLSCVAENAVYQTVIYLSRLQSLELSQDNGWTILAMGKLGAGELNYSSDLDLIILHNAGPNHTNKQFIELSQRLIYLLSTPTKDGSGWRIDMRLRPNPSATAISLDMNTAIIYYESIARSWERAAFIRARPIAGNIQLANEFLHKISPFIWRNTLDYSVIEDLQNWLRHLPIPDDFFGYDVKLGAYGIRHIELITHILQLLGGGRTYTLRTHNTQIALRALEESGWIDAGTANKLNKSYFAWRRVEHRLQYQRDSHTHKLPQNEEDFAIFANLMGYNTSSEFRNALRDLQNYTKEAASHPILEQMMSRHNNKHTSDAALPQDAELIEEWLSNLGFKNPKAIQTIIQLWLNGGIAATSSERARAYLTRLLPKMLTEIANADYPDAAFSAFQDIISSLPAGVQIFALLENNPSLVRLLSNILVKAPRLTDILRYNTYLFDDLLENQFFSTLPDAKSIEETLTSELSDLSIEQALDVIRKRNKSWQFQADIHLLEDVTDASEIAIFRSVIAYQCLHQISLLAHKDFTKRYGSIHASFGIILLGRLANSTLTAQSDLDLIFVYEGNLDLVSDGAKPLGISSYFIRLTQLITNWMSLKTAHGKLYDIDLRLRPDGNAGPVAVSSERLASYYQNEAWIWELFALRDAHFMTSTPFTHNNQAPIETSFFSNKILKILQSIQSRQIDHTELVHAFSDMINKRKLETFFFWNIKQHHGGLLDCFIAQFILNNLDKNYPRINNKLNKINARFDTLIQQLATRLISYKKDELPENVIYFIAIQSGYKTTEALKVQIGKDYNMVKKIHSILLP